MKILAVDDDPIVLELLKQTMASAGYTDVVTVESAMEALHEIGQAEFDCFLLDIQMPETDGIELCHQIRQHNQYRDTPILMITAMSERSYVDRAFQAGATDYVTKPFDVLELSTRVRMAEKLVEERALLTDKQVTIDALVEQASYRKSVSLSEEIALDGVTGAIRKLAFENYVLQLGRGGMFGAVFQAFRITNVADIHIQASSVEFAQTIQDTADLIAEALKTEQFFLCYRGNGIFASIRHTTSPHLANDVGAELHAQLKDLQLTLRTGVRMPLEVMAGDAVRCGVMARTGSLEPLWKALDCVDSAGPRRPTPTIPPNVRQRMHMLAKRLTGDIAV